MSSQEIDSIQSQISLLIDNAAASTNESEKVSFLNQIQELVIKNDVLDNFLDEILNFYSDDFTDVRKFIVNFIGVVCKKEPDYFPKVIDNLNAMLLDEEVVVSKISIQVCTQIYKLFLVWLSKSKLDDETEATRETWNQIKNYIYSLIEISENDGIRTQCIKFIENVIICQTKRDSFTSDNDFVLDQIVEVENKLIECDILENEAIQLFEQLLNFQAKIHISSVNLMATMQSLAIIARQRSKMFFAKVILAFEKLSSNLPPTLAKSQVNSVNKQLKLLLLILFKHPFVYSSRQQTKLSQLLINIGASQSEINRCLQDVRKRGIKTEILSEVKRIKLEPTSGNESELVEKKLNVNDTPVNLENSLQDLSRKFSRHDLLKALDITQKDLAFRLEDINVVCDLVLSSLHLLPDKMSDNFRIAMNDSLNSNQSNEIAKNLSLQLTSLGIGPGVEEVTSKYTNLFATSAKIKIDTDISKKVSNLIKKCLCKEMKKQEIHHKVKLAQSAKLTTPSKVKHFNLLDITKPFDVKDKCKYIEKSVIRILNEDKHGHFSSKQFETRNKILGKLLSEFSNFDSVKSLIKNFIFKDIRIRYDILLNMLYFEYVTGKQNSSLEYYSSCLLWVIQNIIETCETKDRDYFLHKFCIETPDLSENVVDSLKTFILSNPSIYVDCVSSGVGLTKLLIKKRAKHRARLLDVLLQICIESPSEEVLKATLDSIKDLYRDNKLNLQEAIEKFSLKYLKLLQSEFPENGIAGLKENTWNDESVRKCLSLYLLLLPMNQKLIHQLPAVYVGSIANTKRVILRLIQDSIQAIDMNSSEILTFVETCPDGAETLISRVIHILTEKQPPSSNLVSRVKDLYSKRVSDVRFLIPVLNGLNKKEIIAILPQLIKLNPNVVKEVFNRLLSHHVDPSNGFNSPISPADLMIALHNIDLTKCDLKTVIKATNLCFEEKNIFTAEVLAVVMQMLIEQNPLPTLLMRTVIQTLSNFPRLVTFIMNNILQRLIVKQVWTQKKVWEGFIKCCQRIMPQSFAVLLQLPPAQLKSVFDACPEIRPALATHLQSINEQQAAHISQALLDLILIPSDTESQRADAHLGNEFHTVNL